MGTAIGVRETLIATTLLSLTGLLWLVRSPLLKLRDIPDPAEGYGQQTEDMDVAILPDDPGVAGT